MKQKLQEIRLKVKQKLQEIRLKVKQKLQEIRLKVKQKLQEISGTMKAVLAITTVLLFQAALCHCSESDEVNVNARQYDCSYMWMMMNGGPQMTGPSVWMLLCLGITALLFSTDITSVSSKTTKN